MTVWLPVMFRDELTMLRLRLEETRQFPYVRHVVVESPVTHRGVPKPLYFLENELFFQQQQARIDHVIMVPEDHPDPWHREHEQRDAAWKRIDEHADDSDWVLIGDVDEIPSPWLVSRMFYGKLPDPCAIRMRVFVFAVDWEVPQEHLPPQCVAASAGYIRRTGLRLSQVRDARDSYEQVSDGGMHFSWLGGPAGQRRKLRDATCHTELIGSAEGELIESGGRYAGQTGGGLPVKPVEVDEGFPAMIRDRRVPADWYRPR